MHQFKETARTDPYRSTCKPGGTPRCPSCKSVNIKGRWLSAQYVKSMEPAVLVTRKLKCPACRQLDDHFAMGVVELHGEAWKLNKDEVMNTIRRTENIARSRNDQERVLWVKDLLENKEYFTKIYVSLPELARSIGSQLEKSFQGATEYSHSTEEPYIRVCWWSDQAHMKHRPGRSLKLKRPTLINDTKERLSHKSKAFRARSRREKI